jgi:hypothetical protein
MKDEVRRYFAKIGRKGGKNSKRTLTVGQAKAMVAVREARRAFKRYKSSCFWSFNSELKITTKDIRWIAEQLIKNGNREAWFLGAKLIKMTE